MQFDQLIRQRKRDWERLETLLKRVERDQIKTLSQAELVEFGQLYRSATSDLAIAQRDFPQKDVTAYLNQLVGRAHPVVYRGEPLIWRRLKEFYRVSLPQLYREMLPFITFAALLLFAPAIIAYLVMLYNPDAARYILSPSLIALVKSGTPWWKDLNDANEIGAAFIMTNNLRVSFLAYAGGLLFGLLTVYVLVLNGIHLGAILGLLHFYGNAAPLWEFVAGHGVLELSQITMAGGSGLMLGYALLRPGLLTRRDALGIAAQKSIRLLLGTAPLLALAGTIEGMISPSASIPALVKYGIGILTGVLLYSYLFLVGRKQNSKK
ncbi:MAG TPA: stage II sporulation protein M [Anaerolineae bacterium]|nr:stage II sporulation protein M [Anaerolineae bacterium]